ncbi:tapasin-like isoform X1 [Hypanus sabinus]|uniref:tapasin-like isoform X1 n=1 Tax=Hypanus sabinus TaxID=79690 RepID=UPI0028C393D7|nr:tapasin-like isoform X1 [Hypanus sabinus]
MDAVAALLGVALILGICLPPVLSHGPTLDTGTLVDCTFVEEARGKGSFPGAVDQTDAMLLLRRVSGRRLEDERPSGVAVPPDLKPGMFLEVFDHSRVTGHAGFRQPADVREKHGCEINKYLPQDSILAWAAHLSEDERTPAYQSGRWFSTHLHTHDRSFSVSSLHRVVSEPAGEEDPAPVQTSVVLNVFSRMPQVSARQGQDVLLDCGFTLDRSMGFAVEWRYQFEGSGHVVYAYNGLQDRVHIAQEGAELLMNLLHSHGNASLVLRNVRLQQDGTYICTVYAPNLQAQQAVSLHILEPPTLVLRPDPLYLYPDQAQDILCEALGYYPLDVSMTWTRRAPGNGSAELLPNSWLNGHNKNSDGTFNVTGVISVRPTAADHGTVYTCHAQHVSMKGGVRKSLTLKVAGVSGPSVEDAVGMLVCAFVLYGALKLLYCFVFPQGSALSVGTEDGEKEKSQ